MSNMDMSGSEITKSICTICPKGCGVLIYMEKGRPRAVEGDPDDPLSKGKLCIKGSSTLEYVYHPERLTHPLVRSGKRGEGEWKQISWDRALDHVAEALNEVKKNQGAQSVAFIRGASKSYLDGFLHRLANVFGSPNVATMGQCCHVPRMMASTLTCGHYALPDIEYPPSCVVIWGYNPEETFFYECEAVLQAIEQGSKLIVIDPRKTNLAEKADFCIQVRPGTDLALALGMIHIIINENLYDEDFVHKWTVGLEELKIHIQKYTPEKVEEITWVPQEVLKAMTRTYAEAKPACILLGNAIDHNLNSFQTARAVMILKTISGNMGIPGGEVQWAPLPIPNRLDPSVALADKLRSEVMEQRVSRDCNMLPLFKSVTPDTVIKTILDEDPYPIRAAFVQGGNPLLSYPSAQNVHKAFSNLDCLVVADMFMTPTAVLADVVLPAASYLECDGIFVPPQNVPVVLAQRKVVEIDECWSDLKIVIELAQKLGLGEDFVWETEEEALNAIIRPSGLTFDEFKQIGRISGRKLFRQYESKGFDTPSGKIEIFLDRLKKWGYDPLPVYYEPPETPYTEPESSERFPFILTSWRPGSYRHSWGHQIGLLRSSHPEPTVLINSETAEKLGVNDGDWVYIETKRGQIKQRAKLESGIEPRVIMAEYGWWYPEEPGEEPSLHGVWKSNINVVTDDDPNHCDPMSGGWPLRTALCRVFPVNSSSLKKAISN